VVDTHTDRDAAPVVVEAWYKNPLVLAVAAGAVGLAGNVVVAYVNAATSAEADQRKNCFDMIHQSIAGDEDKSRTNLRFLQQSGLLKRCTDIDLAPALSETSSSTPVQAPVPLTGAIQGFPPAGATMVASGGSGGMDVLDGCGVAGDSPIASVRTLNLLRNRYNMPAPASFDANATLSSMLQPGKDTTRWDPDHAGAIEGFVVEVKAGGVDSADCHALDTQLRPTEIYLADKPGTIDPTARVLVEVTPRMRAIMKASNVDWSTAALAKSYQSKRVRVQGWLLFDSQRATNARNTEVPRHAVIRATAWEIAPVTAIDLAPAGANGGDAGGGG
jgi:hypothetical protein